MTPEQQRITIAEACGWAYHNRHPRYGKQSIKSWYFRDTENTVSSSWEFPDYLNDLNAMHEAEKVLTGKQFYEYSCHIYTAACKTEKKTGQWRLDGAPFRHTLAAFGH